jgi:two-component system, sensor histidine kinase and response regulator
VTAAPATILVVDDTRDNAFLLCQILEQSGFRTRIAHSGESALASVAQSPPDMILLDVMMPDIDGYDVTRRIRADATLPFIPIILVTGKNAMPDKLEGLGSGADDYLAKPFDRAELLARVRGLLRLKQSQDALRDELHKTELLYSHLREAEAAREQMLYLLAHDMRTPLSGVISCLELLERGDPRAGGDPELIAMALDACRLQDSMIGDLLDLHRAEAGRLELQRHPVDLRAVVDSVLSPLQPKAQQKQIDLRAELCGPLLVEIDAPKIARVLDNLLRHAIKYTPFGGSVLLGAAPDPASDRAAVWVEDTGYPIDEDALARIFDRYYQASSARHGSRRGAGVGLTFCREIVAMHGGEIWAERVDSRLTRMSLTLPPAKHASEELDEQMADPDRR